MKTMITIILITAILFFVAGCGRGQPFEIETTHAPQSTVTTQVASAN